MEITLGDYTVLQTQATGRRVTEEVSQELGKRIGEAARGTGRS